MGTPKTPLKFPFLWCPKEMDNILITTQLMSHSTLFCRKIFSSDRRWENSQLMRLWVEEHAQTLARNSRHLGTCQTYIFKISMPLQRAFLQVSGWDLIKCDNACKSGLYSTPQWEGITVNDLASHIYHYKLGLSKLWFSFFFFLDGLKKNRK